MAGRAVAGNSFQSERGSRSSASTSNSSSSNSQQNTTPISRVSANAYISGRRDSDVLVLARAVQDFTAKISSMRPGDVVTAGVNQRPGLIGNTYNKDISRNANIGTTTRRILGDR